MADILVRNVDECALQVIRQRAERRGRSLQEELREIIREAGKDPWENALRVQEMLKDYKTVLDPVESIREDRDSR